MYQHAKRLDLFAGIFPDLSDVIHADQGYQFVTTGRHPVLGSTVAIQDPWSDILFLVTECAWPEWLTPFAESGDPVGGHLGCPG